MYSIYADNVCIADDLWLEEPYVVLDPTLVMEENAAGSFEFTLPVGSVGYSLVQRWNTTIQILKDSKPIWKGRVFSEDRDANNNRVLSAEGSYAFLNDTTQPFKQYKGKTVEYYFKQLIEIHNAKVGENRKLLVGNVTVTAETPADTLWQTNYDTTMSKIQELIDEYEGYIQIRYEGDFTYIDYLKDYPRRSEQEVRFGTNLLDYTASFDLSSMATVIVPLGKAKSNSSIKGMTEYLTVTSVNKYQGKGSPYVVDETAVSNFGWIENVVNFNDVDNATKLLKEAKKWFKDAKYDEMSIEANALDLKRLGASTDSFGLLDEVRIISEPHGVDRYLPITKIDMNLWALDGATYTFGKNVKTTLTKLDNDINNAIVKRATGTVIDASDSGFLGSGTTDENGRCVIDTTTAFEGMDVISYEVFLTPYSNSALYVSERNVSENYFVVSGNANVGFAWEIKGLSLRDVEE